MRRWPIFLIFCFLTTTLTPMVSQAAYEIGLNFSYNRSVYGSERQNKQTTRTYAGSLAMYLSRLTALEVNYSYSDDITSENNVIPISGTNISVIGTKNVLNREVYGVGLRQFFARRNAFIRPSISLGYAKQFITDQTDITFQNDLGDTAVASGAATRRRDDSVFGSAGLQFRMSQTLSLDISVNTVFKAFEFNRAGDNIRYSFGLKWFII